MVKTHSWNWEEHKLLNMVFLKYPIFGLFMLKSFFSDIAAFPDSVNILDDVSGDIRTPDKLIDRVNDTTDGRHMWLAPLLPGLVHFPFSFCFSHVCGWNWKHGGRGKHI